MNLGDQVQHTLTGAIGIVVGITEWLYLPQRSITVQPQGMTANTSPSETWSCSENELEVRAEKYVKS